MAVTLYFYNAPVSDHTYIRGALTPIIEDPVSAELYEPCTVQNPNFLLQYNEDILQCNYCSCPQFRRKYFIKDTEFKPGGQMVISCVTDVLNTLGTELLYSPIIITRATTKDDNATYVKDMQLPLLSDKTIDTYKLNVSYNPLITDRANLADYLYVLSVAGGQAVTPSE